MPNMLAGLERDDPLKVADFRDDAGGCDAHEHGFLKVVSISRGVAGVTPRHCCAANIWATPGRVFIYNPDAVSFSIKLETLHPALGRLLALMVDRGATDLLVDADRPASVRIFGALVRVDDVCPSADDMRLMIENLLSPDQQQDFTRNQDFDLSFEVERLARFRCSLYRQRGTLCLAVRALPLVIPSLDSLGLPPVVSDLAMLPRGLVLVTGPSGSGKSTTLAAMIARLNETSQKHVITIEDPLEFLHVDKRSRVDQRAVGTDTPSFGRALRSIVRQNPDVILVGEMRDLETISTALTAAETGHLVFGTLHTQSAPSTIDRIVDVFPPAQQEQVRIMIANSLQAVVTQALLPTADGNGRVAALEILLPDDAVRNLIRQAKIEQVYSVMQTNTARGMQTMEQALADLAIRRVVTLEEALARSSRPDQLVGILDRAGFDVAGAPATALTWRASGLADPLLFTPPCITNESPAGSCRT